MNRILFFFLLAISISPLFAQNITMPVLKGPYLGQEPPGSEPVLFAPGIISNGLPNRDVAMTPDGKEMYFGLHTPDFSYATIIFSKLTDGVWTKPEVVSFASDPRYTYLEPAINSDGSKLFFLSNMPQGNSEKPGNEDIWVVDKTEDGWGKPYNLGEPVNSSDQEYYPSLTYDGTIYFTRAALGDRINYIYRSRMVDGKYTTPEKLPEQVNCGTNRFNAYIAPDESFLVVSVVGMKDCLGGADYYIVFRNKDDTWREPVNMGPKINSPTGAEWSFYISPDKKYIFYMASGRQSVKNQPEKLTVDFFLNSVSVPQNGNPDIYWIDASIIDELRLK